LIGASGRMSYRYVDAGTCAAIGGERRAPGRLQTRIPSWYVPPEPGLQYLIRTGIQVLPLSTWNCCSAGDWSLALPKLKKRRSPAR